MGVAFAEDHRSCETGMYEGEEEGRCVRGDGGVLTLREPGDRRTDLGISIPFNRLTGCDNSRSGDRRGERWWSCEKWAP